MYNTDTPCVACGDIVTAEEIADSMRILREKGLVCENPRAGKDYTRLCLVCRDGLIEQNKNNTDPRVVIY
jgi:hypothetical protein